MNSRVTARIKNINPEAYIWISGILLLVILYNEASAFTVCPFHHIGLSFCPGCGIGASIVYLLKLNFSQSFASHPLGIPAFIIITFRIFTLLKQSINLSERKSDA